MATATRTKAGRAKAGTAEAPGTRTRARKAAPAATATATATDAPAMAGTGYATGTIEGGSGSGASAGATLNGGVVRVTKTRLSPKARAAQRLAELLRTVGDVSRLEVIRHLAGVGEANVGAMVKAFGRSQPALSHSLGILRRSQVVETRRDGKSNIYSLSPRGELMARMIAEIDSAGQG